MVQRFRTRSNHCTTQEKSPWVSFTRVRGGSTLPNLFEPLHYRGNTDYRVISHEFGVVPRFQTCLNQCTTQEVWGGSTRQNPLYNREKDYRVISHEFNAGSNHCIIQGTRPVGEFTRVRGGSTLLNNSVAQRFEQVRKCLTPRTHVNLPCSPFPSVVQWFEEVRYG